MTDNFQLQKVSRLF